MPVVASLLHRLHNKLLTIFLPLATRSFFSMQFAAAALIHRLPLAGPCLKCVWRNDFKCGETHCNYRSSTFAESFQRLNRIGQTSRAKVRLFFREQGSAPRHLRIKWLRLYDIALLLNALRGALFLKSSSKHVISRM